MELTQKACSGTEDEGVVEGIDESKKSCTICKTTKTPMWRVGPLGPKSLCNACGIKYTKMTKTTTKKGENFSSSPTRSKSPKKLSRSKSPIIKTVQQRKNKRDKPGSSSGSPDDSGSGNGDTSKNSDPKKRHSMQLLMKKQRSRRKFGEVERAAVLLLSLSWGSVSA
ncbi:GATA transcription factor 15-like protein [Drosera capensis]